MASNRKILTLGLNPSKEEFSEKRFETIDFEHGKMDDNYVMLEKTLNDYFITTPDKKPYSSWFSRGEYILNMLKSSYYDKVMKSQDEYYNSAIHIDIYSAIATDPTWGKIKDKKIRNNLERKDLCKSLINYLNPDIILCSTNKVVFKEFFATYELVNEKYEYPGNKSSYYLRQYYKDGKTVFWGFNNRGTAFGCSYDFLRRSITELMI